MADSDRPQGKTIGDKIGRLVELHLIRMFGGKERVRKSFFSGEAARRIVSEETFDEADEILHGLHVYIKAIYRC